jgi:CofH/MqnC C-terminal region
MTYPEAAATWRSDDLVGLGMRAHALRAQLDPFGIVTYCLTSDESALRVTVSASEPIEQLLEYLEQARQARPTAVRPVLEGAAHAADYLKLVALCRLYLAEVPLIQAAPSAAGFKVAQLALRFGANDFANATGDGAEESFRRLIRDAGFTPKQRDAAFTACFVY